MKRIWPKVIYPFIVMIILVGLSQFARAEGSTFTRYYLSEDQLIKIARLCQQEQGSVAGAKAEASLMANQLETSQSRQNKYGTGADGLYNWVRNGGWFSRAAYWMDNGSVSNAVLEGVRDVFVNGNRTLAWFVDEHDCKSDIESISTGDVNNNDDYKRGITIITNKYGSTYTFWCFPASGSDPFGYTAAAYNAVGGRTQPDASPEVEWATVTANNSSVPIGTQVSFSVSSNVGQGENGYYYDLYIWDQASYASGGSGTWVGVSANSASYTFNTEGDYYVRFRVHNTAHDLYSDPLIIHVYGQSVSLRITSGTTGSANIVNAGGQVGFEFVTGYTQGQDGCYFDMYVWDYQSYLKGTDGIWVGVVGGKSSYVFNSAGIYFVRARIHNDTMNVYSEPLIIRVPTILQEDFYALILNRACWMPISQVEGSTGIVLKREDQSSKMVWRFQLQNNSAYSNSTYSISSCYDGKMLEMHNGTRKAGTQLTAHDTYWGGAYQQWYLFPIGDGFILQSAHYGGEGWVMDLRNNNTTDGNAIQINSMNGTTAQIWAIYRGNEVQLSGPRLQVVPGNSLTGTTFTWSKSYGATKYNLRIFKDKLYEGQDFSQWSVNSGCTTVLPAGKYLAYVDAVNYHLYKAGATVEFTIPEAYAVSFNLCGGSGAFDTLYKEKGQILLIPENQPTREGFNFIEWNTKADGSGESFHPGDGYIADAGLILYAQWVEQTILYLPAGLKTIESGAFEGISAAIVYVPEGCISIGSRAFANCANLKYIFVSNLSAIDIADDALEGTNAVFIEQ